MSIVPEIVAYPTVFRKLVFALMVQLVVSDRALGADYPPVAYHEAMINSLRNSTAKTK